MLDISSVKMRLEYITLDMCTCGDMLSKTECSECVFKYVCIIGVTIMMCMLKSPSIILFVAVGSRDYEVVSDIIDEHSVCYCVFWGGW